MEFSVKRDNLLKVLQSGFSISERKQTMPILANILLSIDKDDKLTIIATDSEIEAIFTLDIENVKSKGTTTITVKKLLEIARNMPSGSDLNFKFNSDKMKMKLTSGENRFVLSCLSLLPNIDKM